MTTNKQRKKLLREIAQIETDNPSYKTDVLSLIELEDEEKKLKEILDYQRNAETFVDINVDQVSKLMEDTGFITNKNGKRVLNEMGLIASQFQKFIL